MAGTKVFLSYDFEHDFDNVQQLVKEDDQFYGWGDLHTIRPKVEYPQPDFKQVLGEDVCKSVNVKEFWK